MNLDAMSDDEKMDALDRIQESIRENKEIQKQKIAANVDLVIQALKKIESDIQTKYDGVTVAIETRVANIKDGRDGVNGIDGRNGRDGLPGKDGLPGPRGLDGKDGINGLDGIDGVSVTDARIDFDGSLVIYLSNGREINVGEVMPLDLAERIKVITNGGGTSQSVLDTLADLQTQIDSIVVGGLPSQTGNAGKYLTTDGTNASWGTIAGGGDVVGPASATDNAIARYDSTTGKLIQNSTVLISDTGAITGANSIATLGYADFDVTATPAGAVGRFKWNDTDGTMDLGLKGGNVTLQVGQENVLRVTNDDTVTLTDGMVVYVTGANGTNLLVKRALATTDLTSASTIGMITESIATNQHGFVTTFGLVRGLNTSALTAGDVLYLSPSTSGAYTNVKPTAPDHMVLVGYCKKVSAGDGEIFVKVDNGYELDELHNVKITSATAGDLLIYDQTAGYWENAKITAGSGITVTNADGSITIASSGGTGAGDVVGPASSTDNAVARFDGTTGKLIQNSSFVVNDSGEVITGVWKGTELTVPYGGTGVATLTGIVKGNGASAFSAATAGTDYLSPPSGTSLLKANSGGALANATAGTDYAAPTSGTSILYGDGAGGFSNVTVGSGLSFSAGTLTPSGVSLTAQVSGTLPVANGGTGVTTSTGTGSVVLGTSPTVNNPTVTNYVESVVAIGTVTTANTISLTNGTVQTATLTASTACTFTMPTAVAGKSFILLLKQAATTGNGTATFTGVKWSSTGTPTMTATAGRMDIFTFTSDGTNWYGNAAQGYTP